MTVLSSCAEDFWAHKAKSVHHLALYRQKKKKILIPGLREERGENEFRGRDTSWESAKGQ